MNSYESDLRARLQKQGKTREEIDGLVQVRQPQDPDTYAGRLAQRLTEGGRHSPAEITALMDARSTDGGSGRRQEALTGDIFPPGTSATIGADHPIVIARAGLSADGNRDYRPSALKSVAESGLLDGARMFVNHEPVSAQARRGHRDMAGWCGTITPGTARFTGDALTASAHFHSPEVVGWLADPAARKQVGLSADWMLNFHDEARNGKRVEVVESIDAIYSVDIVPAGNLGGRVL